MKRNETQFQLSMQCALHLETKKVPPSDAKATMYADKSEADTR